MMFRFAHVQRNRIRTGDRTHPVMTHIHNGRLRILLVARGELHPPQMPGRIQQTQLIPDLTHAKLHRTRVGYAIACTHR